MRHQLVNDEPLGRSVDEAVRMLDALQYFEPLAAASGTWQLQFVSGRQQPERGAYSLSSWTSDFLGPFY